MLVAQLTYLQVIDANNLANDPNNIRKHPARRQPATRRDPHRRRPDRRAVAPDHRRASSTSACTRRASLFSAHQRVPVVRRRQHRRRSQLQQRAHRARPAAVRNFGQIVSRQGQHRQRHPLADQSPPNRPRETRSKASRAPWSRSTCRPARCWRCTRTRRSTPTRSRATTRVKVQTRRSSCSTPTRRSPRCHAPTASGTRQGRRSRSSPPVGAIMTGRAHAGSHRIPRGDVPDSRARPPRSATSAGRRVAAGRSPQSFIDSCNATFARLGYEMGNDFVPVMNECGVGSDVAPIAPPLDLEPGAVGSIGPAAGADAAAVRARGHRPGRRVHHAARRWRWSRRAWPTAA